MNNWYRQWKQRIISQAADRHQQSLVDVEAVNDAELLALYDLILGSLSGPMTIQVRKNPPLFSAWRLHRSQKAFARAVHHHKKILGFSQY
ncbi:hypothetical protein ABH908_000416 [Pseudomonas frederiksbergensis]|uniref:hypothetical protein n=1 Tax=Pseudomonas TaxID=286 RepID=UPI003D227912